MMLAKLGAVFGLTWMTVAWCDDPSGTQTVVHAAIAAKIPIPVLQVADSPTSQGAPALILWNQAGKDALWNAVQQYDQGAVCQLAGVKGEDIWNKISTGSLNTAKDYEQASGFFYVIGLWGVGGNLTLVDGSKILLDDAFNYLSNFYFKKSNLHGGQIASEYWDQYFPTGSCR